RLDTAVSTRCRVSRGDRWLSVAWRHCGAGIRHSGSPQCAAGHPAHCGREHDPARWCPGGGAADSADSQAVRPGAGHRTFLHSLEGLYCKQLPSNTPGHRRRQRMDFGIFLDFVRRSGETPEETFDESFQLVDLAEAAGLDTVWLGEMHFNPNRSVLSAPIIVACSIATRTERLRVGMAVPELPLIHPLRLAEEAATVDQISKGRFEFGVGRSGN